MRVYIVLHCGCEAVVEDDRHVREILDEPERVCPVHLLPTRIRSVALLVGPPEHHDQLAQCPAEVRGTDFERAWNVLRVRLVQRFQMAREVLKAEGLGHVAALVPIEEVLVWMDEEEAHDASR